MMQSGVEWRGLCACRARDSAIHLTLEMHLLPAVCLPCDSRIGRPLHAYSTSLFNPALPCAVIPLLPPQGRAGAGGRRAALARPAAAGELCGERGCRGFQGVHVQQTVPHVGLQPAQPHYSVCLKLPALPPTALQLQAAAPPASSAAAAAKKVRTPKQIFRDTLHSACSLAMALAALAGFGIASPGAAFRWVG